MQFAGEHRQTYKWGTISHWRDGVACGCDDEWKIAEIEVWNGGTFKTADPNEKLRHILMLNAAFGAGMRARSREIAALIQG